jgi:pSer/pThr/pTyr-binding forkhead associated (FHA) protein
LISRVFYLLVAGGIGGLLGWLISEPSMPSTPLLPGMDPTSPDGHRLQMQWLFAQNLLSLTSGLFIGGLIGGASGWAQGSMKQIKRGLLWGAIAGAIGGSVGLGIGSTAYNAILHGWMGANSVFLGGPVQLLARAVGWGLFGALLGAGQAIATRSWQRVRQGALGGLVGGIVGGIAFEIAASLTQGISSELERGRLEVGRFSRAIGLVCVGSGIGLFVGLTEVLLRSAWIRVLMGRNEGKEYLVDAPRTMIGRSEMADIPLYGDSTVSPQHAAIDRAGRQYILMGAGPQSPVAVNGQPVQQTPLCDGDTIQIGQFQLQFRLKSGQGVRGPKDVQRAAAAMQPPMTPGVCPYCGEFKDAAGRCACAPGGPAPQPTVAQAPMPSAGWTLVGVSGPLAGQRFPIGSAALQIGREALGGIALLGDQLASRQHAHLQIEGDTCVLYDDNSTNGTFVNNAKVTRQPLTRGDTVTIGGSTFRIE